MDSLAQELIDEIIDRIPRQHMPASSLVARRWRRKSQRRNFEFILFMFRDSLTLWVDNIPQDPDGIPSYVRHVRFHHTLFSDLEPGTLARVLKPFTSMISLVIDDTTLPPPDELVASVSLGELMKGITRLTFAYVTHDLFATVTSFIFSLPNLKELYIYHMGFWDDPPLVVPDIPQRGPLELFAAWGAVPYSAFAQWKLASRRLSLAPSVQDGVELLIDVSSETMVALTLIDQDGIWSTEKEAPSTVIHLPSFPSLTKIRVELTSSFLTGHLAGLLSSIHSAPALSSVTFSLAPGWFILSTFPSSGNWTVVDKWLARMVTARATAKAGLMVALVGWPEGNPNWEGYFPEFRRAGGKLRSEIYDFDYWNPLAIPCADVWINAP